MFHPLGSYRQFSPTYILTVLKIHNFFFKIRLKLPPLETIQLD